MLRNPLTWLLLLIASTALAACCGSVPCDCRDELDDAIIFRFNTDVSTIQGFRPEELSTVYILRVPLDTAQRPKSDTIAITGGRRPTVQTVTINNSQPFVQSGSRKLDEYRYTIYLGARKAPTESFIVSNIRLEDDFEANKCCTCNINLKKTLMVNGGPEIDLSKELPDTVLLSRKR
ncbi:hypothetical protein [Hymenobacter sp. YC55]|uniref:hypothetical protein n=1 Tax=Hymenobacter sp. YC55 TaxID=3034019 RepID=UPI0023F92D5B|nr:hypothetical protein [Hymenobacter sp. YC55]MDF7810376.1 hypothetical protein [Hymenobacter sp. YC55]